ncbi:MAG: elongation factor 4 [Candidatus Moranbacteria bacterium CG_4_10_14_3_um_filter_44_15]|nr:MAG: elongation factor 4 [Candidatus Moranbacteria bacterium CG06_land_8_20_14_3_00_43_56]PIV83929.1 MAG: elongation factor 4 [Candidatus Moranbacteria bacterium CG17_big_fil_post_rev_8_21_14_2_50_44_12]PIW93206.1 MAG: elongation factor 4 [Candidatus Moranbacteria bacterium CG_4_8_14_3_um_filter_43_15]PIX90619.1 MAG: elongation factor 4 [Candidatus Moranbacteria bacterium CG_4_10_14_3_um_filter_44_15]PJA85514.1 MAG: elongation factor 4 [Candidatus Moranbacteria bacterium CG_4_9_14_3_um_filte
MANQQNIRNFVIIAHIDHGKSTLADRMLEITKTVEQRKMKEQLLDTMDLEREKGITIKLQPVRMIYNYRTSGQGSTFSSRQLRCRDSSRSNLSDGKFILNLIDTPGHVDFSYEVSRSLAAVEGAVLLVDATKGVQAQTVANLYQAVEQNLEIISAVNKIDLPNAEIEKTKKEIVHLLGCKAEEILEASGKTGEGVEKILEKVIEKIPPPKGENEKPLRALIFDSKYDSYKGVLAYVKIIDGEVKAEDKIFTMATKQESSVIEVGYFSPELTEINKLTAGEIGYIATGFKSVEDCRVGDTITATSYKLQIASLPGYKEVKPMVYASFYPKEGSDYNFMRDALGKLKLNDAAFTFEPEANLALGRGFRCGFLGLLHIEIIQERLKREFEIDPVITTPSVVYKIKLKSKNEKLKIYSPLEMPDPSVIESIEEPYVKLDIISPSKYLGAIMGLMRATRAEYKNTEYIDSDRIILTFESPLTDVIIDLHDKLKSASSGFASMNYEFIGYRPNDLVKLDILVAGDRVEAFSRIVPRQNTFSEGKGMVEKLKEFIPRQNFQVALQATVGGKILARETLKAFRKDVTAKLYGGDVTRKRKLLEKQKKGKKKMTQIGRVEIPSSAFLAVLRK